MDANITRQLSQTNEQLFWILDSFDDQAINSVPFPDSWTAAQVADHLHKSDRFIHYLLTGPAKETSRKPDEYVKQLADTFLNFETRMKSPEMIVPDAGPFEKAGLLERLKTERASILGTSNHVDLTRTTTVASPLGESTFLELLHFHLFHTQRHIHQLRKIRQHVAGLLV